MNAANSMAGVRRSLLEAGAAPVMVRSVQNHLVILGEAPPSVRSRFERFWASGRQPSPYRIMEGLSVIRAQSQSHVKSCALQKEQSRPAENRLRVSASGGNTVFQGVLEQADRMAGVEKIPD
jgi:hypothetical protein